MVQNITVQRQLGGGCPWTQILYFWQPALLEKCQKVSKYSSSFMPENISQHFTLSGANSREIVNFFQILFGSTGTKIHKFSSENF